MCYLTKEKLENKSFLATENDKKTNKTEIKSTFSRGTEKKRERKSKENTNTRSVFGRCLSIAFVVNARTSTQTCTTKVVLGWGGGGGGGRLLQLCGVQ